MKSVDFFSFKKMGLFPTSTEWFREKMRRLSETQESPLPFYPLWLHDQPCLNPCTCSGEKQDILLKHDVHTRTPKSRRIFTLGIQGLQEKGSLNFWCLPEIYIVQSFNLHVLLHVGILRNKLNIVEISSECRLLCELVWPVKPNLQVMKFPHHSQVK